MRYIKRIVKFLNEKSEKKVYKSILQKYKVDFENNSELDNSKSGECYILGNGPSINEIDFKDLSSKDIFVLNLIAFHKDFKLLNPKYFVVFDPYLFNDNEAIERKNKVLEVLDRNPNITMFTNVSFKDTKLAKNITNSCKLHFLKLYKRLDSYSEPPLLSKPMPDFGDVALHTIYIALAMGYKKIYLLGCDETNIITSINAQLGFVDDSAYGYKLSEDEKDRIIKTLTIRPFEDTLSSYAGMFHDFALINDFAKNNGCTIYNCSKKSLVKCFKYIDIKDAINESNY